MKRTSPQGAGTIKFRFVPTKRRWAVFLPHVGCETASFEDFKEAGRYAVAHCRSGQKIKWPCTDELRERSRA